MKDSLRPIDVTFVLGIRPDVIRASIVLKLLEDHPKINFRFVWSGQHYSDNLKDIFFRELEIPLPDVTFESVGDNDVEIISKVNIQLFEELTNYTPRCVMFLGDTNTVLGSVAAMTLNIPIIHIEGCMRSYDWRMPEEKCRTIIDNISDVIYTYFPEYKLQGVLEGIAPNRIVVIGNLIVDVLNKYYWPRTEYFKNIATEFLQKNGLNNNFYLATAHRRENVENHYSLTGILKLFETLKLPVIFPASYRTQKSLKMHKLRLPKNLIMVDPIGYELMLGLMSLSKGVITDSGTVVEETAVIGVPSIQMRRSTERPQTYDCKSSVKFDPDTDTPHSAIEKLKSIQNKQWEHRLGDGLASNRLITDLVQRLEKKQISTHNPNSYHIPIERSYQGDGL
jgi:UDP-N-acetylglucosamine 2-epimerase